MLGILTAVLVSGFSMDLKPEYPGPKLFPLISVFGFIVCGSGLFIKSLMEKKDEDPFLTKDGWKKIGLCLGVMALYIIALIIAGFILATPVFLFLFITIFAGNNKTKFLYRILYSVIFSLVIYVVYVKGFHLNLPGGLLF
jgi:hypothetical protein